MVQVDLDSTSNDSPALAPIAEDNAEEVTIPPLVTSPLADILDKLLQPIRGRKGRRKVAPIAEEVPTSKEVTTPLADDPSAKAPMETSKPACRKQLGRRDTSCACVRTLLAFAVLVLSMLCCFTMASMAFFTSYALLHESLRSAMLPPIAASSVLQELVETGATLYGVSWCGSTQKQMADLGITMNYTQGLDYVDCEAEAVFCRRMNVASYPTWRIAGRLYPEHYSPEKLLEKLLGDHDDDDRGHHLSKGDFSKVVPVDLLGPIYGPIMVDYLDRPYGSYIPFGTFLFSIIFIFICIFYNPFLTFKLHLSNLTIFIFGTCISIIFQIIIFEIIFGEIIFEIIMDVSRVLLLAIFVFVWWRISTCHAKFYVKWSGSKDGKQEERDDEQEEKGEARGEEKGEEIDERGGLLAVFVLVVLWNWALPFILNDDK